MKKIYKKEEVSNEKWLRIKLMIVRNGINLCNNLSLSSILLQKLLEETADEISQSKYEDEF